MTLSPPTEAQFDALREVANVGCGHAANALSKLVGGRAVRIDVPCVVFTEAENIAELLGNSEQPAVVTSLDILGQLEGRLLLVLEESEARRLSTELLASPVQRFEQPEMRVLEEAGNIVASACLNAIASFTGLRLLPSTPAVSRQTTRDLVRQAVAELEPQASRVTALQARFVTFSAPVLSGQFLVLPRRHSVQVLFEKLGV
jgi:chemotaxis protein CheC